MVRAFAMIAAALWVAFLISTATSPDGTERVDVGINGTAVLFQVLALVFTVVTVALAALPGRGKPETQD
jgi:hypothetical protein